MQLHGVIWQRKRKEEKKHHQEEHQGILYLLGFLVHLPYRMDGLYGRTARGEIMRPSPLVRRIRRIQPGCVRVRFARTLTLVGSLPRPGGSNIGHACLAWLLIRCSASG